MKEQANTTEKNKAKELVDQFTDSTDNLHEYHWKSEINITAKRCALICVQFAFDALGDHDSPYTTLKQRQELTQIKFAIEKI